MALAGEKTPIMKQQQQNFQQCLVLKLFIIYTLYDENCETPKVGSVLKNEVEYKNNYWNTVWKENATRDLFTKVINI